MGLVEKFRFGKWRWDLLGVGASSLLFSLVTTPASGYFIHTDSASEVFVALSWSQNCWQFIVEKMTSVFVLTPLFILFGPNPLWDTITLAIVAAIGLMLVYETARELTNSSLAGLIAVLLLSAFPAYQFFSRVHIGYVLPFLLGGWLAIRHNHWGRAGFCFGMALISHFGAAIPVGLSVAALAILHFRPQKWKQWAAFGLGCLAPIAVVEGTFFAYLGIPLAWMRSTFLVGLRWSGVSNLQTSPIVLTADTLLWLPQTLIGSNGWLLSTLLMLAIPAPFLLRKEKNGAAMTAVALGAGLVFASIDILKPGLVARSLAPLYPIWVVSVAVSAHWLIERVQSLQVRRTIILIATGISGLMIIQTGQYIREFTQTPYPQLATWLQQAAEEARPVRYMGVPWVPIYFLEFQGTELLVNDDRWVESNTTGQDVLVFQDHAPPQVRPQHYKVTVIELDDTIDAAYPILTGEAAIPRRYEIWWPQLDSQPIGQQTLPSDGQVRYYYSGLGCSTPPPYQYGTMYFYQLVIYKFEQWLGLQ